MSRPSPGFASAVVMAALVGLAFVPALKVLELWAEPTSAAALYLTLSAAASAAVTAASPARAVVSAVLLLSAGLASAALSERLLTTALTLTLVFGFCRGRLLGAARLERPWLVELCLGAGALLAAKLTASPSLPGIALGVWAYWLVQSAYFLLPVSEARRGDAFDAAVRRAAELLDNES